MKIRTIKYIAKEGMLNAYKNKLMTLASVGIVGASLVVFGIFILFLLNVEHNTKVLNDQLEMRVFCDYELPESDINAIEQSLKANVHVESVQMITAQQAFANLKESLGEDATVLEGFDESLASASFIVKLKSSQLSSNVMEQIKQIPGVRKVTYFQEVIDFISKFTYWINMVSLFLLLILLIVSVFIISNTIKLTVFARRREISIMKYIGATDWFIRWPFVVEGILIGMLGAVIAFLLTRYTYGTIEFRFNRDLTALSENFISLIKIGEISLRLLGYFLLLGSGVGAVGSVISIRKYLKV